MSTSPHDSYKLTEYNPKPLGGTEHCGGEHREDKSDDSDEYCSYESETCSCKCEGCKKQVKEDSQYWDLEETDWDYPESD